MIRPTSLLPGDEFPEQINREIDASQAVIVIWTENSVQSKWVRAEANRAYEHGKLVAMHAEGFDLARLPLPFNTLQSSPVTDRAKVFAALARRGIRPSGDIAPNNGQKIQRAPDLDPNKVLARKVDSHLAAKEWARLEGQYDIGKLKVFARHYAGTYHADLAQEEIAKLEEEEAWKTVLVKREPELVEKFLEQFPNGKYTTEANKRIILLKKKDNGGFGFLGLLEIFVLVAIPSFVWVYLSTWPVWSRLIISIVGIVLVTVASVGISGYEDVEEALNVQERRHLDMG